MAEILVAPPVNSAMIAWLTSQLPTIPGQATVPVYRDVPKPRPDTFVRVRSGGGAGMSAMVVDGAQLNIEAWAKTSTVAYDLARNARAVALAAKGETLSGSVVYRVEDGGHPVDLPDPLDSGQHRYTFTVVVHMRASRPD